MKSAKERKKIAPDVPLGKIKNDKGTHLLIKKRLRIQTQRYPRKSERARIT